MLRVFFRKFNDVWAKYEFRCRNKGIHFSNDMFFQIIEEINHLCFLRFTEEEINYIANISWMKEAKGFHEFLKLFQLNKKYIKIEKDISGNLKIVAEGPIWIVSMFEIYVLAIVNEIYFDNLAGSEIRAEEGEKRLTEKINFFNKHSFPLTEFGTRRRYSNSWQEYVLNRLTKEIVNPNHLTGTSNVYYAKQFNIKALGTMAHEFICLPQGLKTNTIAESQKVAFDTWMEEYRGDLGIALTDTLGQKKFLKDFDKLYANAFTGVRHDSGDPIQWGEEIIKHYVSLGIDPTTKTLMFSDSLDFEKAYQIYKHFYGRCKMGFGIGTFLTNDMGMEPLNIVMKLTEVNNKPVAKLSNVEGKTFTNDSNYVTYLKEAIK